MEARREISRIAGTLHLHNAFDAVFHVEEAVFFLIAVIGAPVGVAVGRIGAAIVAALERRRPA